MFRWKKLYSVFGIWTLYQQLPSESYTGRNGRLAANHGFCGLDASLLTWCKSEQAMWTHPDIGLMTARSQACRRLAATCGFLETTRLSQFISLLFISNQQVTCEDILDDLRDVFKLFIDRALFLDCLLIDPELCHTALNEKDLPYVLENTEQVSKGKTKDIKRLVSLSRLVRGL